MALWRRVSLQGWQEDSQFSSPHCESLICSLLSSCCQRLGKDPQELTTETWGFLCLLLGMGLGAIMGNMEMCTSLSSHLAQWPEFSCCLPEGAGLDKAPETLFLLLLT